MKTLEKMVASVAVAGLLVGGAAPAFANNDHQRHGGHKSDTITVVVEKYHEKSGKTHLEEKKELRHREAARYAAKKCDKWRHVDRYEHTAKKVEKWNNHHKREYICSYDHRNNKHVEYHVYFKDNDRGDRHWDHDKDRGKKK